MNSNADKVLINGLHNGFAEKNNYTVVQRGKFDLLSSEFSNSMDYYIDQYIAKRLASGQEIAKSGNEISTRVYAGGIVSSNILQTLGINEENILDYLKKKIAQNNNTRLYELLDPITDGDWQYEYNIIKKYPELPLTVGEESISYKGVKVFIHVFLNSPIE